MLFGNPPKNVSRNEGKGQRPHFSREPNNLSAMFAAKFKFDTYPDWLTYIIKDHYDSECHVTQENKLIMRPSS